MSGWSQMRFTVSWVPCTMLHRCNPLWVGHNIKFVFQRPQYHAMDVATGSPSQDSVEDMMSHEMSRDVTRSFTSWAHCQMYHSASTALSGCRTSQPTVGT